jgi:hypothetical protein
MTLWLHAHTAHLAQTCRKKILEIATTVVVNYHLISKSGGCSAARMLIPRMLFVRPQTSHLKSGASLPA